MASKDPSGSVLLSEALQSHITSRTKAGYASALKRWLRFCEARKVPPFPADELWLASYVVSHCVATSIAVSSLKVYLSAIQYEQVLRGHEWTLKGSEMVRRALRFVKKRYGAPGKALKVPVSLSVLRALLQHVPGWPRWERMCHDDRVFVAASVIAICGFLRGGEFLYSAKSVRRCLRHRDVTVKMVAGEEAVCVDIAQPKNMWWLEHATATCFDPRASPANADGTMLGPVTALKEYRRLSVISLVANGPAFVMESGDAISRDWMVSRTFSPSL